ACRFHYKEQIVFAGGQIDLLDLDSEFLGKLLCSLAPLGSVLDRTDSLMGPVQRQNERWHVILHWFTRRILIRSPRRRPPGRRPVLSIRAPWRSASGHAAAPPSVAKKFRLRCSLPCDPPAGGHSCDGRMIPRFLRAVWD